MPIFRLTPISAHLAEAAWQKSTHHTAVFARAGDDRAARTLVSHACRAWVESRSKYRSFWVSPWEDPRLVTCVQVDKSGYAEEGRDTMLWPQPDDEA